MPKLYIYQDKHLVTFVVPQQQTRFSFRENVFIVITRYFNDLTVNIMCYWKYKRRDYVIKYLK